MADGAVAYVVKGYPRLSELFIASEICRLEQLGVRLRLIVLKPPDEAVCHPVVGRVAAVPDHLAGTTSLSSEPLFTWLRRNAKPFLPAVARVSRRHPARLARATAVAGAQAVRARKGWRPRKIYVKELLQAVAVADRVERAGDVTHLHAHFAHGTTTVTWLAAMLCRIPFSFTGHAKDIYREELNPSGLLARKLRAASFAVTCTGANASYLRRIAPDADVRLVYHGLNADFAQLVSDPPPATIPARFRVVSVGRMVTKKGFDVLVDSIAVLRERGLDVELVLAGEAGDETEAIVGAIEARGLTAAVTLRGPLSQAELLAEYRSASVFALACRVTGDGDRDGIPNVLVEAMAAGLPVVSTRVSGIPELIVDGENGLLVPPDRPHLLADALWRIGKDPALAGRLAAAGRATVAKRFDGDVTARRMADLFA